MVMVYVCASAVRIIPYQVKATMRHGVRPLVVFHARLPTYVTDHLVNEGNSQNELASGTSHCQKYMDTPRLKTARIEHRKQTGLKARKKDFGIGAVFHNSP